MNPQLRCADWRIVRILPPHDSGRTSMILQSLAGLPAFLVYFCAAILAVVAYPPRLHPHHPAQRVPADPRQ
jgi:hypothetical protein